MPRSPRPLPRSLRIFPSQRRSMQQDFSPVHGRSFFFFLIRRRHPQSSARALLSLHRARRLVILNPRSPLPLFRGREKELTGLPLSNMLPFRRVMLRGIFSFYSEGGTLFLLPCIPSPESVALSSFFGAALEHSAAEPPPDHSPRYRPLWRAGAVPPGGSQLPSL